MLPSVARPLKLAVEYHQQGRLREAESSYREALRFDPDQTHALHLLGVLLTQTGRPDAGAELIKRSLALLPDQPMAHASLGDALARQGRAEGALECYDRALSLSPQIPCALTGRGQILLDRGRNQEALRDLDVAALLQQDDPAIQFLRGRALAQLGRPAAASECFQRVHALAPGYEYVLGARLWVDLHACQWRDHSAQLQRIEAAARCDKPAAFPFIFFSVSDSPELQLRCARRFAARYRPTAASLWQGEIYQHERIRIAYVSEDFRSHPTSYLMMDLWERHDRQRFEITAISLRPAEDSAVGRRVVSAFDRFIDASALQDADIARRIRDDEIDVAVDLMGYTGGVLHSIFARRPAPVQANYLGYPGTMGSPDADYLIADEFLIPDGERAHFSEQIVYLPGTYQPNDSRRAQAARTSCRADWGLPVDAFVWCCFNNAYKFNPQFLDVWCRLLAAVPASVLWLIAGSKETERNLRLEAASRSIDPARLVFAPAVPNPEHVERIALADVCLDTAPVNGATTTSDALWAGVPVVSCAGRSFVSRMTGSLLNAVGLPELVVRTRGEYEHLALALANNPTRLAALRDTLREAKSTSRLFDTDRTRRNLEAAYVAMWERARRGLQPEHFAVREAD
jgi:predicted O-linked N-acetylglucosamine transferase (SPINDLY family)